MHIKNWINDFLNERGEFEFTGEPVYQYKITDEEFSELKVALELDLDELCDIESYSFTTGIVLYCCEWWRREYEGSNWSWTPIFESLGAKTPNPQLRNKIVEKGLKRLKRPILQSQGGENEYLGTIAFESGIPRSLLIEDHYFSKVIADGYLEFLELSSFDLTELQIVEEICSRRRIPVTYKNRYFYQLIKKVVDELINLNNRFDLRSLNNPVEYLNENYPEWKHEFPIAPDSEIAIKFINQLLSDTSRNRDVVPLNRLHIKCRLIKLEDSYSVQKIFNLEEGIIDHTVLGITKDEWMNLSDVLEIYSENGNGDQRCLGSLYKISKEGKFSSGGFYNMILSESIFDTQKLKLEDPISSKSIDLRVDSPNLSDNENPIFFSKVNEDWELKSVGSSRLKASTYRVLLKDTYSPTNYESELNYREEGVNLFQIEEPCKITDGYNRFSISFTNKEEEIRYHILPSNSHSIPYYPNKNKEIFLGMPRIYQVNSSGILLERVRHGIEYLNSSGEWKPLIDNIYGKLKIRKRDSTGTTMFNLSINVLPKDFRVEFLPGKEKSQVVLFGANQFKKSIETATNSSIEDDIVVFHSSYQNQEDFFVLKLHSSYSLTPVKIQFPIPKDITSFKDEEGKPIPTANNVFLGGLFGKRFITNNLKSTRQTCCLVIALNDPNIFKQITSNFYFELEPFGTYEIPLVNLKRRIQTLFSISPNNDSFVSLRFGNQNLIIRQFDSKPYFLEDSFSFKKLVESVNAFRLDLAFNKNSGSFRELQVSSEGLLVDNSINDGLWFIYPKKDSGNFFCPVVWIKSFNAKSSDQLSYLHEASLVRDFNDRQAALIKLLLELVKDPGNREWKQLAELFEETEHIPLATLDIWKASAKSNTILASMFFIMSEKFILRLTDEFSILWRTVKISEWDLAFEYYRNYIENLGLPDEISNEIIFKKLESINSIIGVMTVKSYLEKEAQPIPLQLYDYLINEELNGSHGKRGLRSRKIDQEWPDHLNVEIRLWLKFIPLEFKDIFSNVNSYQKAVVFLPVILAASTVNDEFTIEELADIKVRFLIEQIKDFDSEWFEKIFDFTQGYLLTKKMQNGK
ncbi:MAG: STY4851/ECs_5259 family protein [Algoriphagus sp.]|uniref:STY4851/ECs_5259 family protein n=1 Tax=Algoriphagus sp. TaxID=1872435 RepID=UPI00261CA35D|nr:STY4851/ECs_5259 family protein [Algoriphagus sp.]MDG1276920.1 STY4851/ECs_5259 family protein [Algoriphagus sp.]